MTYPFIHLRTHSQYSLLKSLTKIPALIKKAKEFEMKSIALTDYNNMYGAIEFYKECKSNNIKPILGVEIDFRNENNIGQNKIIFLSKDNHGYKSLMNIVSIANLKDGKHPHITINDLIDNFDDNSGLVIILPIFDNEIGDFLIKKEFEKAKDYINKLGNIFENTNIYIELSKHSYLEKIDILIKNTIDFVKNILKEESKLIISQNSHYINEDDKSAQKILFNINNDINDNELFQYKFSKNDFSFLNTEKIKVFTEKILKEYNIDLLKNTFELSEILNTEIESVKWHFPNIAKDYQKELDEGKTLDDVLKRLALEGIEKRKIKEERVKDVKNRLFYELDIIKTKGYAPYFLVVYDIIKYADENGILSNIRGSVAGSITTYLLFITKCDPLIYQIPFERFLNPERPSAPDIDMDFADNRRDEIIEYVRNKYEKENVAQIGTFGTMLARGAVKDVARAMKYPYSLGDKISKMIPMPKQGFPVFIDTALKEIEDLKKLYDTDKEVELIINMAKKVEGLVRHIGVHAAGVVIAPNKIINYSPIQLDPKGENKIITQYDMHSVDENNAGLLKFDFLGIKNLTILKTALNIVKKRYGVNINIEEISLEDKKTFEILSLGETMGLFQLNGTGMTKFLKDLMPTSIYDINAMIALYRPGPIENIPIYIERKKNNNLVSYLYDDKNLKEILEKTFGVLVYQDDLLLMSIKIAGYSWGEADKFRKAVGKKIPEEMQKQKEKFISGCINHSKWPQKKAEELWKWIEPFASYGFNKAHSASYGRVAYQTAYMKANYPVAFMTAILIEESGDNEKISDIISESRRMGIEILPPNINHSFSDFIIVEDKNSKFNEAIRFGIYTIKNLGKNIAEAIIKEREENGKYKDLENFINRINHKDLNKKSLEALIMSGAMDDFGERAEMLFNLEDILEFNKKQSKENTIQNNIFNLFEDENKLKFKLKKCPPVKKEEKLLWEKTLLGCYVSGSPLDKWKDKLLNRHINIKNILNEENNDVKENNIVNLPVLIEKVKITKTKNGELMALIKVSDLSGSFEIALFPKKFQVLKEKLIKETPLIINGKIANKNGEKTMILEDINMLK